MVVRSINEDVAYTASTSPLEWEIRYSGDTVASGVSGRRPDQEHVTVYPNRVVEDLLSSEFPTATGVTKDAEACKVFNLTDTGGTVLESYTFVNSSEPISGEILNAPVNGHCDPRQRIYLTRFGGTAGNIEIADD